MYVCMSGIRENCPFCWAPRFIYSALQLLRSADKKKFLCSVRLALESLMTINRGALSLPECGRNVAPVDCCNRACCLFFQREVDECFGNIFRGNLKLEQITRHVFLGGEPSRP